MISEFGVITTSLAKNLLLGPTGGIGLFHRDREAVKHGFVHDAGSDKAAVIRTLALGIGSGEDLETDSRSDPLADLLEKNTLAFQHRLEAHHIGGTEVDLVQQEYSTIFHGGNYRTIAPNGLAVDEAEATQQIILVGLTSNVHPITLAAEFGTNLLHHEGLTVTGQTSNENRIKLATADNLLNIREMSPGDVAVELRRHQRVTLATRHAHRHIGNGSRFGRNRCWLSSRSGPCHSGGCGWYITRDFQQFRQIIQTTTRFTGRILSDPRRRASVDTSRLTSSHEILTRNRRGRAGFR